MSFPASVSVIISIRTARGRKRKGSGSAPDDKRFTPAAQSQRGRLLSGLSQKSRPTRVPAIRVPAGRIKSRTAVREREAVQQSFGQPFSCVGGRSENLDPGLLFAALLLFEKIGLAALDEVYDFAETAAELAEVLLIEENLVPVEDERPVGIRFFAAFGDREEIVAAAGRSHVEEISPAARLYRLREDLFSEILTALRRG